MTIFGKPMRQSGNGIVAGFAFVLMASASTAAFADCSGTGTFAGTGFSSYLPFASGGAVNSLVSAINASNTAFLSQSTAFVSAPANPAPNQEGGGVWARAIGGEVTTKSTSTTSGVTVLGTGLPGNITCNNQTQLRFAGTQVGTDTSVLNYAGWNLHLGTTVGYLGAKATDKSSAGPLDPQGGTFQDTLQVPFAGVYFAVTKGGLFIDGQVRFDYYQNSLNDPIVSGLFNQKLDARGWSFTGNIGYNQALQNNWFIEPSAGIVVSKVKVDPLNVTGTLGLPASASPGVTFPGQLRINDIDNTLGRLSVRGGTTVASGNMIWQPFAIASVYHDFSNGVDSAFDGEVVAPGLGLPAGQIHTTGLGTYGQFGVGVAAQIVNTGWLGYFRGDYRTGSNIEGYSLNGGLRYQFAPDAAPVAPLYTKAPVKAPPMLVTAYDWTGFFIGGSFGVEYGKTRYETAGGVSYPRFAGPLGGGQIGYDKQFGKWVVGVEGALNAVDASGGVGCQFSITFTCATKVTYMGTATAKLGYAFTNRSLWYVRAGGAFGDMRLSTPCNTGGLPFFGVTPLGCDEATTRSRVGWTAGFGSEFALTRNWTVRAETNYFDMGSKDYVLPVSLVPGTLKESGFVSTVGLNYRFAPGPVVAKY